MSKLKWYTLVIAMVLLVGLLAGCGNNSNNSNNSNTSSEAGPENDQNTGATESNQNNEPASSNETANNNNTSKEEKLEGEITIWTFFGQVEDMGKQFELKHPEVTVNVKIFPGDQYQTKLLAALHAEKDAPDLFDLERAYIGKFINSIFVADLSAMGAEELVENYVPYVQELGRDEEGIIRGISDHSSPGGFWYVKEAAKKYLGTDDPDEISAMVSDYDKIIELGEKIYNETNGEIHLIQSVGNLFDIEAYNTEPWYKDGALHIDPRWEEIYAIQKEMRAKNVDAKLGFMSGGWGDALNEGNVLLTAIPAWAGFMISNGEGQAEDKFGVAKTPKGFYMGGTYRTIYEKSENKELAYEFVKYIASAEWQQHNLEATGNMPGLLTVYEDNLGSFTSTFFGDQDILKPYYEMMKETPALRADNFSEEILGKWRTAATHGIDNDLSYEEVVETFKADVANAFPEIDQ